MTTGSVARDLLAAEFALGVLDSADRRRALTLYGRDQAFTRQVDAWNQRFAPLNEGLEPESPPVAVWDRIEAELGPREKLAPGASRRKAAPETSQLRLIDSLRFWRWCASGSMAAAAAMACYVLLLPASLAPQPEERYVAVLNNGPSEPAWLVTVDLASKQLTIRPVVEVPPSAPDGDRALELWLVADGEAAPRSLGLLKSGEESSLVLPASWSASESPAALAISLEPQGGSPTGRPTGPVVFQGSVLPLK